jgi:hypothetical protein
VPDALGTTVVLAFLNLSDYGEALFEWMGLGAFLIALVLSLIPMRSLVRKGIIASGVVGAYVFAFVHSERGLDRLGWLIVMSSGVIGWLLGFAPASLLRFSNRNADRSPN